MLTTIQALNGEVARRKAALGKVSSWMASTIRNSPRFFEEKPIAFPPDVSDHVLVKTSDHPRLEKPHRLSKRDGLKPAKFMKVT